MKKNKKNNYLIYGLIGAIIIVLLFYVILNKKSEIVFKFKETNIKLKIGETKKINYDISDSNLLINWSSNSDSVIVSNGEIKAINYGNAIITGMIDANDNTISDNCMVTVYSGDDLVPIEKIDVPEGTILMKPNSEFDLPFMIVPNNAYITSVEYQIDDENIAIVKDNKIISINPGSTLLTLKINNNYQSSINIKVSEDAKDNKIIKEIQSVSLSDDDLIMEVGDSKTISYTIVPEDGFVSNIEWYSTDEKVVSVNDGIIKAVDTGEAIIKLVINDTITRELKVKVKASNAEIIVDYNPKTVIRIGESTTIKSHLVPSINEKIIYKSSNPNVVSVTDGIITGIGAGSSIVTMSISNGKTKSFTINVLPKNGSISGIGNLWGYKSLNAKTPVMANLSFFQKLAQTGIGVISGNSYIITDSGVSYTYNLITELLLVNNKKIKLRIYYPEGVDLSITNTLVYMGGRGETNFYGVFSDIKKDPSLIKSGGIVALIAEGEAFNGEAASYVTKFLKAITKQKNGVKNSILGFSDGAHQVLEASKYEYYDRMIIFSGYVDYYSTIVNAQNSEIIFMIASSDGNYKQAKTAINNMIKNGFQNVTIVSMGNDLSRYEKDILVINPGNQMKNGHYSINVINSGIIEYATD